jgi:hypothetical protein
MATDESISQTDRGKVESQTGHDTVNVRQNNKKSDRAGDSIKSDRGKTKQKVRW